MEQEINAGPLSLLFKNNKALYKIQQLLENVESKQGRNGPVATPIMLLEAILATTGVALSPSQVTRQF